jgi:hypothetical protein
MPVPKEPIGPTGPVVRWSYRVGGESVIVTDLDAAPDITADTHAEDDDE